MCKSKQNLIQNIYFHLNQYGEFILWDVDINMQGESHKASKIFINSNNIAIKIVIPTKVFLFFILTSFLPYLDI